MRMNPSRLIPVLPNRPFTLLNPSHVPTTPLISYHLVADSAKGEKHLKREIGNFLDKWRKERASEAQKKL